MVRGSVETLKIEKETCRDPPVLAMYVQEIFREV